MNAIQLKQIFNQFSSGTCSNFKQVEQELIKFKKSNFSFFVCIEILSETYNSKDLPIYLFSSQCCEYYVSKNWDYISADEKSKIQNFLWSYVVNNVSSVHPSLFKNMLSVLANVVIHDFANPNFSFFDRLFQLVDISIPQFTSSFRPGYSFNFSLFNSTSLTPLYASLSILSYILTNICSFTRIILNPTSFSSASYNSSSSSSLSLNSSFLINAFISGPYSSQFSVYISLISLILDNYSTELKRQWNFDKSSNNNMSNDNNSNNSSNLNFVPPFLSFFSSNTCNNNNNTNNNINNTNSDNNNNNTSLLHSSIISTCISILHNSVHLFIPFNIIPSLPSSVFSSLPFSTCATSSSASDNNNNNNSVGFFFFCFYCFSNEI
jgi:hypothetical protein